MIVTVKKGNDNFLKINLDKHDVWMFYGKWAKMPKLNMLGIVEDKTNLDLKTIEEYAEELSDFFHKEVTLADAIRIAVISRELTYVDLIWRGGLPKKSNKTLKVWFPKGSENAFYVRPAFLYNLLTAMKYIYDEKIEVKFEDFVTVRNPLVNDKVIQEVESKMWDHQREAVNALKTLNYYGAVQIPTGGGKTLIGAFITATLKVPTIVLAPTVDILRQWERELIKVGVMKADIGYVASGKKELGKPVLLMTYTSSYKLRTELMKYKYQLVILDEAHRTPARTFALGVMSIPAKYRVGLTATYWRDEFENNLIQMKLAPLVLQVNIKEIMEKGVIVRPEVAFRCTAIDERTVKRIGNSINEVVDSYVHELGIVKENDEIKIKGEVNKNVLFTFEDKILNRVAINVAKCEAKMDEVLNLIKKHSDEKIIVFTEYVELATKLDKALKKARIPSYLLTASGREARKRVMEQFETAKRGVLITAKVGDEGINIPDASIGIIVASGSTKRLRQFIQRMGRIVRRHEGKEKALLYFMVCVPDVDVIMREMNESIKRMIEVHEVMSRKVGCVTKGDTVACGSDITKFFIKQFAFKFFRDLKAMDSFIELLEEEEIEYVMEGCEGHWRKASELINDLEGLLQQ